MEEVLTALEGQVDELWSMVSPLSEAELETASACEGWSIADVLLHLAQTNEAAAASANGDVLAVADHWDGIEGADVDEVAGAAVAADRGVSPTALRARWLASADAMLAAFRACDPRKRVRWVVGEMAARTLATTRIAETWIHTGDIAAGLDVERAPSDSLWHIGRLVHRTLPYAFERAGQDPPGPVRFELGGPAGSDTWSFGAEDAPTLITGPALDLCRVAGQRATAAETALTGTGPDAAQVLALMRTFA